MGVTAPHGRSESGFLLRAPRKPKTRIGTWSGVGTEVGNVRNRVPAPPFRSFFGAFSVSQTGTAPDPNISDWRLPQCRRTPFCTMTVLIACKHSRHPPNNENVEFRRFLHACIWVETRISGIESSQLVLMGEPPTPTHPIYCALGSRAYSNLNLISTHMEPDVCTQWPLFPHSSPFLLRTPVLQPAATHRDELSRHITFIMSLFALFLEALAGTVTILSAPKLLDRVLTHLCRWPLPDICIALTKCSQHGCYHWGPASHSGILPAFLPDH